MPTFTQTKFLPYKAEEIYQLVMDIEKYPEFLPWCKQAKIIEVVSDENVIADLLINFKTLFEKYRSNVKHGKDENGDYFVNVNAIEGPFKTLINQWRIKDLNLDTSPETSTCHPKTHTCHPELVSGSHTHSCEVEFYIQFQFNSFFLDKMLGSIFNKATKKMMSAFESRANQIYSPQYQKSNHSPA